MKTTTKNIRKTAPETLEQAAGNGPMMVWNGPRSQKDIRFMTDYFARRKEERNAQSATSAKK